MGKGIPIGLDKLFYAIMTDETNETYGTPVAIPGARQITVSPNTNTETLYADDKAAAVATTTAEVEVTIGVKDLSAEALAALLGHTIDSNGVLIRSSNDEPPYVAIGYRRRKNDKTFRYTWLFKGKFYPEEQSAETKGDSVNFQTPEITGTFIMRDKDGLWQATVDEGDPNVQAATLNNWFNSVYNPTTGDATVPTLSSTTPANNATAISVSTTYQWGFSEAVAEACVNGTNFFLVKDSDGAAVAGTLSRSGDGRTITFTPSAALTAATAYRAVATTGVKDLAGNALAAVQVRKFTTA